jgi:hypothetical protein
MTSRAVPLALAFALLAAPTGLSAQQPAAPAASEQADTVFTPPPLTPGGAFLRSLVLPGWAQAELGAETRGAFYFLAETFSLFMVVRSQIRLSHAERTEPDLETSGLVESRRQQREDWIALAVFWAFFSAADGWVSVQLFGFEERTGLRPEDVAFQVGWKIPFGP